MSHKYLSTFIPFAFILVGCSTAPPKVSMSTVRLSSPEVHSEPLKANVSTGMNTRVVTTFTETGSHHESEFFYIQGGVTVADGIEVSLKNELSGATSFAAKYQFSGARSNHAEEGNFSQALSVGYEGNSNSESSGRDQEDYWKHKSNIYDVAWILGYRLSSATIVYGGPFYQWGGLHGEQRRGADSEITELNSDGKMLGANLAVEYRFNSGIGLAGELVISEAQWDELSHRSSNFNFKVDYYF